MTKGLNYEARPLPPTPTPDDVICLFDDAGTELTDVKILSGMARAKIKAGPDSALSEYGALIQFALL